MRPDAAPEPSHGARIIRMIRVRMALDTLRQWEAMTPNTDSRHALKAAADLLELALNG